MSNHVVNGHELHVKIQIVDECNLNCVGCDHFAPLAPVNHVHLADYAAMVADLRRITDNHVCEVIVYGGEPLLHGRLIDILRLTRAALPSTAITVETNGTLLAPWLAVHRSTVVRLNVTFKVTTYEPTRGVLEHLMANFADVKFEQTVMPSEAERLVNDHRSFKTRMFNVNLSPTPTADPREVRASCYCKVFELFSICVRAGRAYACPLAMCAGLADATLGSSIAAAAGGVELATATFDDLRRLATGPIDLCAHCGRLTNDVPWSTSTKADGEWFSTAPRR